MRKTDIFPRDANCRGWMGCGSTVLRSHKPLNSWQRLRHCGSQGPLLPQRFYAARLLFGFGL
jgi:hypothetical protein